MVVSVHGQEVPVPLDNIFRHYLLYPEQIESLVRQLLGEIEEAGLERPEDRTFSDSAMNILPQICRKDWVFENAPAFGDGALVHREFGPELLLCYVIDDHWSVVFVCNAHLRCWGRTEEDLFHLAKRNLHQLAGSEVPVPQADGEPVLLRTGDGFDAARVLLLDSEKVEGLLVAVPERDVRWLAASSPGEDLATLMHKNQEQSHQAAHPISPHLYRMSSGHLVPVTGSDKKV